MSTNTTPKNNRVLVKAMRAHIKLTSSAKARSEFSFTEEELATALRFSVCHTWENAKKKWGPMHPNIKKHYRRVAKGAIRLLRQRLQ